MAQADYLVSDVLGKGEFDWDFRCLDEGLMHLVGPYMAQPSGVTSLFCGALDELGASSEGNTQGALFVEYGHYATLINDYYTFHPEFFGGDISRRKAALLTQLRYAGQHLSNYPRYMLVNDSFALPDRQQVDLHDALSGAAVIQGASRGVLLAWMRARFKSITREQYLQNAINSMHSYIVFPVALALILAGADRPAIKNVRIALAYLAQAMKLLLERETLRQEVFATLAEPTRATLTILSFPGLVFVDQKRSLDAVLENGAGNESVYEFYVAARDIALADSGESARIYDSAIGQGLDRFEATLQRCGILENWGGGLANALRAGSGA